jgi:hypothetical protein
MPETEENSWPPKRPLKQVSIQQIEDVISKAISELTSKDFRVSIANVDWEANNADHFADGAEMKIRISPVNHLIEEMMRKATPPAV